MRIGIVGGGLMGSGIAEVSARAGVDVTLIEVDTATADRSRQSIERSLERAVGSGKLDAAEREEALSRLVFSSDLGDVAGADAAIEAIIESEDAKRELFRELDRLLPEAEF